jgi:hypothetical protein
MVWKKSSRTAETRGFKLLAKKAKKARPREPRERAADDD